MIELIAFSDHIDDFSKINTSIVACSVESPLAHLKWFGYFVFNFQFRLVFVRLSTPQKEGGIRGLQIPLIADKSMAIAKKYGVLNEEEGIAYRFVFNN